MPVVGLVHGIAWFSPAPSGIMLSGVVAIVATLDGVLVITVVGVPIAAVASFLLRSVRSEVVHLLVVALLGAAGFAVLAALGHPYALALAPYGIVAAVVGRWCGKRFGIARADATRARRPATEDMTRDAAWREDDAVDGPREPDVVVVDAHARPASPPDPRRNDFGLVDVGVAWVAGTGTLVTVAVGVAAVLALQGEPYWASAGWHVAAFGTLAMTIVGVPWGGRCSHDSCGRCRGSGCISSRSACWRSRCASCRPGRSRAARPSWRTPCRWQPCPRRSQHASAPESWPWRAPTSGCAARAAPMDPAEAHPHPRDRVAWTRRSGAGGVAQW